jgi:hypothetical protein
MAGLDPAIHAFYPKPVIARSEATKQSIFSQNASIHPVIP